MESHRVGGMIMDKVDRKVLAEGTTSMNELACRDGHNKLLIESYVSLCV